MKIALYNGFPFHYEMFAFVLDFLQGAGEAVDVYTNTETALGWLDVYAERFRVESWIPVTAFNPAGYDYVFLLTDDDESFQKPWFSETKVIVVEHYAPRELRLPVYKSIQVRHFQSRTPPSDPATWMLPVWEPRASYEKYEQLTVVCIGVCSAHSMRELKRVFRNFNDIHFIIINRNEWFYGRAPNIELITGADASKLIECAARSHYILTMPANNPKHHIDAVSAATPLGFSVGTLSMIPQAWINMYELGGIHGMVGYSNSCRLSKPNDEQIRAFDVGRAELFARRDVVLYNALK